jgi:hypothetical protein
MQAPVAGQVLFGAAHVHIPAPVQVRFPMHAIDAGIGQVPFEHVRSGTRLTPEQVAAWQTRPLLAVKLHTPFAPQVPLQVAGVPAQSALLQHAEPEMHAPLQSLLGDTQVHTPAPVHISLAIGHAAAAGNAHTPVLQCPTSMRLFPEQVAVPHVTVAAGYEQAPFAAQVPPHGATPLPMQSSFEQQFAVGIHVVPHALKPLAQFEHRPAPEQVKPLAQAMGAGSTQVPLEQVPVPMRLVPEQEAVPQVPVG